MKKITAILLAICALGVVMGGCARPAEEPADAPAPGAPAPGADAPAPEGEATTG